MDVEHPEAAGSDRAGGLVAAGLSPHPPIVIPEVGGSDRARARQTVVGLTELARRMVIADPATVVVVAPHGPVLRRSFVIYGQERVGGDFGEFGAPGVRLEFGTDIHYVSALHSVCTVAGVSLTDLADEGPLRDRGGPAELHYAALVPLYYLRQAGYRGQVVVVNMAYTSLSECYRFGGLLERAAREAGRRIAVLASGDLSHRLKPGAPAGYDRRGAEFDSLVMEALRANNPRALLEIDPALVEAAGECGLRPVVIMFGAAATAGLQPEVLSYEGPFGVGYGTAFFGPGQVRTGEESSQVAEHPLVALARRTIETYVRLGEELAPPSGPVASGLPERAGAFVSLHRRNRLRGCIGTIAPTQATLSAEVVRNAIAAATEDPRFRPLTAAELADLEISVDVLGPPEQVRGREELDPKVYGVIVERGHRRGLLLPDLEGVDTVDDQIAIAAQKAGLDPGDPGIRLLRFKVERFH